MPENSVREAASELASKFDGVADVTVEEVEAQIEKYYEMSVPLGEATQQARKDLVAEFDVDNDSLAQNTPSEPIAVGDINEDEAWVDLRVQFVEEWEPKSESIAQVGLLGDESGTIKFVSFETSDLPELEVGESYSLSNVVTDEYQGNYSVKLNRTTGITPLDETIEVADNKETLTGVIVDCNDKSGLIDRCSVEGCSRILENGTCAEHGDVDGELDMRIKATLDTGSETVSVFFDAEDTAALTGIGFEKAQEIAKEALDKSAVLDDMLPTFLGKYITVTGPRVQDKYGEKLYVDSFNTEPEIVPDDPDAALIQPAREVTTGGI